MTSKHDSKSPVTGIKSGQKRPITYGKSPRRPHLNNTSRATESSPASWQDLKSDDVTMLAPPRPSPNPKHNTLEAASHLQRDGFDPPETKEDTSTGNDSARKRKRSSAFAPVLASGKQAPRVEGIESTATSASKTKPRQPVQGTSTAKTPRPRSIANAKPGGTFSPSPPTLNRPPVVRMDAEPRGKVPRNVLDTKRSVDRVISTKSRRPRLIDTLAAQRADSPDPDLDPASGLEPNKDRNGDRDGWDLSRTPSFANELRTPASQQSVSIVGRDARSRPTDRLGDSSKGRKIKFTYSQARSIRNEPQKPDELATGDPSMEDESFLSQSLLPDPIGMSGPAAFAFTDDDDAEDAAHSKAGIKSVHELRRAGANHRFSDEMDDLLTRIGSPSHVASTMRRNSLLDLAQRLRHESFASQFRDHAYRDDVARDIGMEEDIISGFALAAVLVIFLSSGPAPHLLRQLADDGVGKLLARLIRVQEDISDLASQKKTNMPRTSRTSLNNVKNHLLQMRIWHGHDPVSLSPRTVALQLLDIITRWADVRYLEGVMGELEQHLAEVADNYALEDAKVDTDFALIARVFEAQSSVSTVLDSEASRTTQHSFTVAKFLQGTLQRWPDDQGELESTILKLAINTTNTAGGAAAFDDRRLLSSLASSICNGFNLVQEAVSSRSFQDGIYDELLLILGVLINVVEHCSRARFSVDEVSLERLVALYLGNHKSMAEADSVDTSKLSVAFGYLAILLGYLSLAAPIQATIKSRAAGEGSNSLVESIQEFISMYKSVDSRVHELEWLVGELRKQ